MLPTHAAISKLQTDAERTGTHSHSGGFSSGRSRISGWGSQHLVLQRVPFPPDAGRRCGSAGGDGVSRRPL